MPGLDRVVDAAVASADALYEPAGHRSIFFGFQGWSYESGRSDLVVARCERCLDVRRLCQIVFSIDRSATVSVVTEKQETVVAISLGRDNIDLAPILAIR